MRREIRRLSKYILEIDILCTMHFLYAGFKKAFKNYSYSLKKKIVISITI